MTGIDAAANHEAMLSKKILVLDAEGARRQLNVFGLRCAGFTVDEATDGASARSQIAGNYPHLILIIATLLDFSIQDFVRALRGDPKTNDLPIVALIEHESEFDAKSALDWGLDDYMLEPISPEEFVTRVRATMDGRAQPPPTHGDLADITLDNDRGALRKGGRTVAVGPTDRRLFELLLTHPEQLIPRELLLFRIWGGAAALQSRVLDVSVCRLRRALEQLGCKGLLQTVSRHGYRLATRVATADARARGDSSCNDDVTFRSSNARGA
jgi:two-component system phosphate regulon response regulator PhoB